MEIPVVTTTEDHFCGRCRKIIPAGSKAWEIPVRTGSNDSRGRLWPILVKVWYHPYRCDRPPG